jgi:hypothetical protein
MNGGHDATRVGMPARDSAIQDYTTNRKNRVKEAPTLPFVIRELFQKRQAVFRSKWSRCSKTDQYLAVNELTVEAYLVERAVHE